MSTDSDQIQPANNEYSLSGDRRNIGGAKEDEASNGDLKRSSINMDGAVVPFVTSESLNNKVINVDRVESEDDSAAVLSFHHLDYKVRVGKPFRKKIKTILRDVSGIFEPGLNAIMGPTGGGKTSLLDLLAKRKTDEGLRGDILLNGQPLPRDFRLMSGYVTQDDVIMGTLTVRENLEFAANLRLRNCTKQQKEERVNELIHDLGLEKCMDTKVGTELIKGVSGGERKRCNIGIELVTKPMVLFLDEPTTGLDASTSYNVISLLRELTVQGNRTIVFSIHQPRYSIFRLFDRLHLLSCYGQTVYHGMAQEAVTYFAAHDLVCETYNNPPDFFLDIILEHCDPSQANLNVSEVRDKNYFTEQNPLESANKIDLPGLFRESSENQALLTLCSEVLEKSTERGYERSMGYATNWGQQFFYVAQRSLRNLRRDPQSSIVPLASMVILATLVGSLYLDLEYDLNGFQNLFGALFFVAIQMLFGNVAALQAFIAGRSLFLHESANGFYRVSSYFVATLVCDLLPLRTFPTIVFGTIFYWMVGLKSDYPLFMFFHLTNVVTTMCACSLAFFVSVASGVYAVAQALISVLFVVMMLFSGLILNVASMPAALRWLQYISIPRYCLMVHAGAQIVDINFCGMKSVTVNGTTYTDRLCESGKGLLKDQDIDYSLEAQWSYIGIMVGYIVTFFGLTYIFLRNIPKKK